jgi:stage V sporulation protein B
MLFPDSHQLEANFLRLGSIAVIFYSLSTVSTAILQGIDKMRIPVINSAISLGIHIVLVFVLLKFTPLSTYSLVIGNVSFALVICILNWISIEKYLNYKQEIMKTFAIPTISAGLMGVVTYFTYLGLHLATGSYAISTILSLPVAVLVYFGLLIFMKGIEENELYNLPKGEAIVRILKKLHLL